MRLVAFPVALFRQANLVKPLLTEGDSTPRNKQRMGMHVAAIQALQPDESMK